jgi:superfamily II DNA or RNA helicase
VVKVGSVITLGIRELSVRELEKLERKLTFVSGNQEVVECFRHVYTRNQIKIPRGAWDLVNHLDYVDLRSRPDLPKVKYSFELDAVEKDERFAGQYQAVAAMFKHEQGQIFRPPGTGKSQIALAFACLSGTSTLVLVHTEDILQQWLRYAEQTELEVGVIQGQKCEPAHLTIATIQTIKNYVSEKDRSWWKQFGCVISDESHHGAAPSWDSVLNWCPAFYRFGFTASPTRADGMHPALRWIFGPVIHKQKFSSPVPVKVVPVKTGFKFGYRGPFDWGRMVTELIQDDARNEKIAEVVNAEISHGNSVLVLSRRIEHLERIAGKITGRSEVLTGGRTKADRSRILQSFRDGDCNVVLATQLADEALDVPRLNRVVLTHPGKHEGRLIQQIGRTLREFPDKRDAVIYDVVDDRVGVLRRQWMKRKKAYKDNGISIKRTGKVKWR